MAVLNRQQPTRILLFSPFSLDKRRPGHFISKDDMQTARKTLACKYGSKPRLIFSASSRNHTSSDQSSFPCFFFSPLTISGTCVCDHRTRIADGFFLQYRVPGAAKRPEKRDIVLASVLPNTYLCQPPTALFSPWKKTNNMKFSFSR